MTADTWRDHQACAERTRAVVKAWLCDEEECYMTYLPLTGFNLNLSARGSLVICPTGTGQTILPDCFSFPCFNGVDFLHCFVENLSSEFMEAFMVALISFL
jgi:hypothetical protein